ncbi:MAG: hypothetical protein UW39_C0021G0016 [Parcubacteria group bacterium GW2011_GWC2_44_17]|nr:MAG: hypothetical protein UW39_C0021G0016 [Parcubacteria group bacterium GW2011_GWC2_44_17]KKT48597.1 MAG: hypothetical protein UW40_C0038G0019 [Parcubacteria group bacterium GW2011_GWF2_44_17]OGY73316.1 MAG: hypothetical protein A3H07_01535 [Candidatus Jacksonbacteria bacterium RIFCSPLOWO2_12_FULL_44_15b]
MITDLKQKKKFFKGYWFLEYPGLDDWPEDIYNVYSFMNVDVGYEGAKGISSYRFHVYTPQKLAEIIKEHKFIFCRHTLIVEKFDLELIKKAIEGILPEIEKYGDDVT